MQARERERDRAREKREERARIQRLSNFFSVECFLVLVGHQKKKHTHISVLWDGTSSSTSSYSRINRHVQGSSVLKIDVGATLRSLLVQGPK